MDGTGLARKPGLELGARGKLLGVGVRSARSSCSPPNAHGFALSRCIPVPVLSLPGSHNPSHHGNIRAVWGPSSCTARWHQLEPTHRRQRKENLKNSEIQPSVCIDRFKMSHTQIICSAQLRQASFWSAGSVTPARFKISRTPPAIDVRMSSFQLPSATSPRARAPVVASVRSRWNGASTSLRPQDPHTAQSH